MFYFQIEIKLLKSIVNLLYYENKSTQIYIKNWSVEELPREKLISQGPQYLSNSELLALLIGIGNQGETAIQLMQRLLVSLGNDLSKLHRISIEELLLWKGIGPAKAVKIKAALELGKRIQGLPAQKKLVAPAVKWLMTLCFL